MPRKPKHKQAVGRPNYIIDWNKVDEMLFNHANGKDIAEFFCMHPDTLYDRCYSEKGVNWTEYYHSKRQKGKEWLRGKQRETAEKNPTMQIWLGKQWCGQRDDPQAPTGEQMAQAQVDPLMKSVYDKLVAKGLTPLEAVKRVNKALMELGDG